MQIATFNKKSGIVQSTFFVSAYFRHVKEDHPKGGDRRIQSGLPRKIAWRLSQEQNTKSWSRPVVQLATAGVGLGVALMILALAVVTGFQREIQDLAIGFQSHITVLNGDVSRPWIVRDAEVEAQLAAVEGIVDVAPFTTIPGICETTDELSGVILKGIGPDAHNHLLEDALISGNLPVTVDAEEVVLSRVLAQQLRIELGDRVAVYLISDRGDVRPRTLTLVALYDTGMLEFDEEFVFIPQAHIQRAAGWGVELLVTASEDQIQARGIGSCRGEVIWRHAGEEAILWQGEGPFDGSILSPGTRLEVVMDGGERWGQDTAWVEKGLDGIWQVTHAGGAWQRCASGYELRIADFQDLQVVDDAAFSALPFGWTTKTVVAASPDLFAWLGMLDLNVQIIIVLMVLIAVINMSSAMLIIILERRPMVGMLRALGMNVSDVTRIFFWKGIRILGLGFAFGNALGLGLVGLQASTGIVRLDAAAYYLDCVPVQLEISALLAMEFGAFAVSAAMLWLPGLASAQIHPAQTLRMR